MSNQITLIMQTPTIPMTQTPPMHTITKHYSNGKLHSRISYLNRRRHGPCMIWHSDGTMKLHYDYYHGRISKIYQEDILTYCMRNKTSNEFITQTTKLANSCNLRYIYASRFPSEKLFYATAV